MTPATGRVTTLLRGSLWVGLYLALVLLPLVVLLLGHRPPGTGFTWDFSVALGFAALSLLGSMFVLTARFRWMAPAFGIDIVYYFHRWVAVLAFGLVLAHPLLLIGVEPLLVEYLKPGAPWHMLAGAAALAALGVLVVSSLWRKRLHLHYDAWRRLHALVAVLAVGLAIAHVIGVDYYVGAPGKGALWTALAVSWLALLLHVRIVRPAWLLRRPYTVVGVQAERGDAWTLTIEPSGHDGLRFQPGQFVWRSLGRSPFAMQEHPFSIATSAERPARIGLTIKCLGDFTARIQDALPGQRAYVDGPFGAFSVDLHPAPGYVFIAGGIGIAPILGMLRTLADRHDRRPLTLFYAYKNLERLTAYEDLEALRARLDLRIVYVLFEPPPAWRGESGCLTKAIVQRHLPAGYREQMFFICGPTAMTDLTEKILAELGVPIGRVHTELFDLV
ncbi:MAG: hypothetical protein A2150_01520 [Candidatus Muproteobacteria bacterium RBG_16_64_11]|uniref:FAD-binding FR-type domain-containing protein n=1 Tax=Candidatus Muproteobacteria bacterium RBG_16_64_11 TaxID=1817758 RepID=A0A1F6T9J3_9PROT|nr:MAG: hypothetical protein A2150_01520 [Candidatus Muproteobacteria bacterium RBG_16_64_11]